MLPECSFNSQTLRNIFQNKQLALKTGRDVSASLSPVIAVTDSSEIRRHARRISEMASGRGSW